VLGQPGELRGYGISIAVCAAFVGMFTANGALNEALKPAAPLPTTLQVSFAQVDAIGVAASFTVLLNLSIVLVKKLSPFVERLANRTPIEKPELATAG